MDLTKTPAFQSSSIEKRLFEMAFSTSSTTAILSTNPATSTFSNPTTSTSIFLKPTITRSAFSNPTTTIAESSNTATFTFSNPTPFTSPTTSAFLFSNRSTISSAFPSLSTTTTTSFSLFKTTTSTCSMPCIFGNVDLNPAPEFSATRFTSGQSSASKSSSMPIQRKPKPRIKSCNPGQQLEKNGLWSPVKVDASTQTETELRVTKLLQGLKEMLLSSKHSDFVLNVQGKEFKVHKVILEAHSPVFAEMIEHDTIEKATGIVKIDDFEPPIINIFLEFLYTARVENLNSDNVIDLYKVADKYQVKELCDLCAEYMTKNISLENFCDFLNLSLLYHVQQLTEVATEFFLQNTKQIAITAKWGVFLSQNPVAGNELYLKALKLK